MLDIRYIVGSLIITVAVVAFAISLIVPLDRNTTANATLKPRIEPSRIVEQSAPEPKAAQPKQAAAPAKAQPVPAPDVTGTISEPKPAPKRAAPVRKKDEPEFGFQFPWLKGWQQN